MGAFDETFLSTPDKYKQHIVIDSSGLHLDSIVIGRALLLVQVDKPGSKLTLSCLFHFLLARVAKIKQALSKDPAGD